MAEPQTAQEPTMEEILASIRRIISEDDAPAPSAAETSAGPSGAPLDADSDDVLELTTPAEPSPFPPMAEPSAPARTESAFARFEQGAELDEPKPDDSRFDPGSIFDGKDDLELAPPTPQPVPAPAPVAAPQPVVTPMSDASDAPSAGLLSQPAAAKVGNAFSQLTRNVPLPAAGRSLEDLVQEMMKPMLKAWLDEHLPRIVEAKVQAEVERLSRQG